MVARCVYATPESRRLRLMNDDSFYHALNGNSTASTTQTPRGFSIIRREVFFNVSMITTYLFLEPVTIPGQGFRHDLCDRFETRPPLILIPPDVAAMKKRSLILSTCSSSMMVLIPSTLIDRIAWPCCSSCICSVTALGKKQGCSVEAEGRVRFATASARSDAIMR